MTKKTDFAHEIWLAEETDFIKDKPLPKEISKLISSWNMQKKRYDNKPTDNFATSLQRQSVEIGDKLQTWKEQGLPDATSGTPPEPIAAPVTPAADPPATPAAAATGSPDAPPAAPAPPAPEPTPEEKATLEREQKVEAFLTKEGRIHHSDLTKVMGTSRYGAVVQVGKIRLRQRMFYYYKD